MAFDFETAFRAALAAGVEAAKPGGKMAQDWIRQSAAANRDSLRAIAEGVANGQISKETAAILIRESDRALDSEANALAVMIQAAAQAAVNAFIKSLSDALSMALKLPL